MLYPENIALGLEQPEVNTSVTGKFVLEVTEEEERDRHLTVTVEPALGLRGSDETAQLVGRSILARFRRLDSEFADWMSPVKRPPIIHLRETGDPGYFPPGAKHRHTRT